MFEACWDDDQWAMHQQAAGLTRAAFDVVWDFIADRVRRDGSVRETEIQRRILDYFREHDLVTDHPPIVGAGPSGFQSCVPARRIDSSARVASVPLTSMKLDAPAASAGDADAANAARITSRFMRPSINPGA